MSTDLTAIYYDANHPAGYRGVAPLVAAAAKKKINSNTVREWLQSQDTYTLHKPARKRFPRNKYTVYSINELWQCDLNDMRGLSKYNDNVNYILTVIDVFSKQAYAALLKRKTPAEVIKAFDSIFSKAQPKNLQSDKGTEFTSKEVRSFFKARNINYFTTNNPDVKAAVVERFNRTLKTRMWRYLTHKNTYRYIDVLNSLVDSYNHSVHRSIKMCPADVNESNSFRVWKTLYGERERIVKPKLSVGDFVRISKSKGTFEKGYETNWSEEIYRIVQIIEFPKPLYRIHDLNDEMIEGYFYEQELQKVIYSSENTFKIDKILATRGKGRSVRYLVKWVGYSDDFNSWVRVSDLQAI